MKRYAASAVLTLCLLLGACGALPADPPAEEGGGLSAAAGLTDDTALLTVNGREIPAWKYLYWLSLACQETRERYQAAGVTLDWSAPVSGGTLAECVKEQALADTALYAAVEALAEQHGITAQPEETAEAAPGLTAAQTAELDRVGRLYVRLCELARTEGGPLTPTAEELEQCARETGAVTVEVVSVPFGGDREAARSRVSALFARVNGAAEPGEAFAALLAETGGSLRTVTAETDPALAAAAQALTEGQCSGILETEDGFALVRRLAPDSAALSEACLDRRLQTAAESAAVVPAPAYDRLDPAAFAAAQTETGD